LSGLAKEQVWIITSIFGFPLLLEKVKTKILGITIIIVSLSLFYYLMSIAIPQALGGQHFALGYFSDFGNSPAEVIKNVIFSPEKIITLLFEKSRLEYLRHLFMPIGFISLLSPAYLIFAIPNLLIGLLSNNSNLRQIYYQYTSTITPFIFISGIYGTRQFIKWFPKIPKYYIATYLLIFTCLSAYFFGPLPAAKHPNIAMFTNPQKNRVIIDNFLSTIPEEYSVAASNNLGSHLSQRQLIYTIPMGVEKADVILFLLNDSSARPSLNAQVKMAADMKSDKKYIKVFEKDNFVVFKKQGILL
ncbi:MAG: DUF2079 domain-containing protein, partial [Candidatus Levybacteria bacterium]|nr:DUF2079 domain-containing protein [Candidatus Levybacteria bacterium]